jgi:uncharacterized protein DUF4129
MMPDEALTRLHAILAQPDYQVERSRSWWDRLWQPVGDLVSSLLVQLAGLVADALAGRSGPVGWAALIAAGLVVLVGIGFVVRAVRLRVVGEVRLLEHSARARQQRSDELYQHALRLAAAGQLDQAARVAYLSALYALDERALLHVQSGLTNRELARQLTAVHPTPELGETFATLVQRYDHLRYGHPGLGAERFADLIGLVERARALAAA